MGAATSASAAAGATWLSPVEAEPSKGCWSCADIIEKDTPEERAGGESSPNKLGLDKEAIATTESGCREVAIWNRDEVDDGSEIGAVAKQLRNSRRRCQSQSAASSNSQRSDQRNLPKQAKVKKLSLEGKKVRGSGPVSRALG